LWKIEHLGLEKEDLFRYEAMCAVEDDVCELWKMKRF
jgi:hypothetical protein